MIHLHRRAVASVLCACLLSLVAPPPSWAELSDERRPVLALVGLPGKVKVRLFGRDEFEKMRQLTYRTSTIWTDGTIEFRGVSLNELLTSSGVTGGSIRLTASNDYTVDIPLSELEPDVPMVAYLQDGAPMSLRDKGPLWVIYPYDRSADYRTDRIYTRSIWQLVRIDVLP